MHHAYITPSQTHHHHHHHHHAPRPSAPVDAGNKTFRACAQACLVSLQIRMPDFQWLNCNPTNARYALAEQSQFQEALIVAEAYGLNHPSEWAPVLWNKMLKPELTEEFVAEFVAVLPLHPSMLIEIARYFRAEMAARIDQNQFSIWITGGGLPAEWAKYLARSFRCLLRRTRDLRLRVQMATIATGFGDVIDACMKAMDRTMRKVDSLVESDDRTGYGRGPRGEKDHGPLELLSQNGEATKDDHGRSAIRLVHDKGAHKQELQNRGEAVLMAARRGDIVGLSSLFGDVIAFTFTVRFNSRQLVLSSLWRYFSTKFLAKPARSRSIDQDMARRNYIQVGP